MKWYIATMVYQLWNSDGQNRSLFEEQLYVLRAEDDFHAFCKARVWGEREAESKQQQVWRFVDVTQLCGWETAEKVNLNLRVLRYENDATTYLKTARRKSAALLELALNSTKKLTTGIVLSTT